MRPLCTTLAIMAASIQLHAQNAPIDGMGPYKLGVTTAAIMDSLSREINLPIPPITVVSDYQRWAGTPRLVAEIGFEKDLRPGAVRFDDAVECADVRKFLVRGIVIAGIIELGDAYFTFYKGVLASITCDRSKNLGDALRMKFGNPTSEDDSEIDGLCAIRKNRRIVSSWERDGRGIQEVFTLLHSKACEEKKLSYVAMFDRELEDAARECAGEAKARRHAAEDAARRNQLKGF